MLRDAYAKALLLWERVTGRLLRIPFDDDVIPFSCLGLPPVATGMVMELTLTSNLVAYGLQLWLTGQSDVSELHRLFNVCSDAQQRGKFHSS